MTIDPVELALTQLSINNSKEVARLARQEKLARLTYSPKTVVGFDGSTGRAILSTADGGTVANGDLITSGAVKVGQVVNTRRSNPISLWVDALPFVPQVSPVVVVPVVEERAPRILALGDYYGFANDAYTAFPDNRTFALNMFRWLGSGAQRIATFSTESLQDVGGDISIDAPDFSLLRDDLVTEGFTIDTIDLDGDLEAILNDCDIFFCPLIIEDANQLNTAQANLLADFVRRNNGLVMVSSWQTNENYTGLYDVFGIQPISSAGSLTAPVISPTPEGLEDLLEGVTSYRIDTELGGLIFADPASPNTFTEVFDLFLAPGFNLGFAIELEEA